MLALLPTVLSLFAVATPPAITPADAAKYVGKEVVVQGTIDQIALTVNLTTHINFGGRYPNHAFTATIFKAKQSLFTGVRDYEGKAVIVQGVVRLYRESRRSSSASRARSGWPRASRRHRLLAAARAGEAPAQGIDLRFDARGADFTAWVAHFKSAVAQQWSQANAAVSGAASGKVDFDFVVEKDGSMSAFRMLKSSGAQSLDRAAANALSNSRCLPLPADYPAQSVMMQVTFVHDASRK